LTVRQVVPNVYLIEGLRGANVYLLVSAEQLALVDSGLAGDVDSIAAQLQEAGHAPSDLDTIILTHAHGDHTGGAAELAHLSGAQVLAHQDEIAYIEGNKPMPADALVPRVLNWLSVHVMFRGSSCDVGRALEDDDVIDVLGGTRVIHTPGHTPGSICLYQPERRILFCGDALFNANPISGAPGLRPPIRLFSVDNAKARDSVGKLSRLAVDVLCCGHGEPIAEGAEQRIGALLEGEHGR
jgi:glyoxylase-like metal-dependent hydrolase (beta-lactamase superfamily II)